MSADISVQRNSKADLIVQFSKKLNDEVQNNRKAYKLVQVYKARIKNGETLNAADQDQYDIAERTVKEGKKRSDAIALKLGKLQFQYNIILEGDLKALSQRLFTEREAQENYVTQLRLSHSIMQIFAAGIQPT